jgi:hypothetical protein
MKNLKENKELLLVTFVVVLMFVGILIDQLNKYFGD